MSKESVDQYLQRLHFRRTVSDIYAAVRNAKRLREGAWQQWRDGRDQLFGSHPQSALDADQKANFAGLDYYPYDPRWRFEATIDTNVTPEVIPIETDVDGIIRSQRVGKVHLAAEDQTATLSLFWLLGYGGGIFLPFRDATNGDTTYGGGRYLLDTIKHADLGQTPDGKLILDFNYAYNPSCAYNHQWSCPLAPPENWLTVAIPAGEKMEKSSE